MIAQGACPGKACPREGEAGYRFSEKDMHGSRKWPGGRFRRQSAPPHRSETGMIHGEVSMRSNVRLNVRRAATAILLGAALMGTSMGTSPATAAWHGYISHPL